MNLKRNFTFFIILCLTMIFWCGSAFAASYEGKVDGGSGNTITGWAWDASAPDSPVDVTLSVVKVSDQSVVFTNTVTADQYRQDLETNGKGNGNHSFAITVDWSSLEDVEYQIQVTAGGITLSGALYYLSGSYSQVPSSISSLTSAGQATYLGSFKTTAYCPCRACSEGWGRHTSTGTVASFNHTVAVDPRVIPYGSKLLINGVVYTAEDKGGAVRGNHIDIFFDTHGETRVYGTQSADVYLLS